MDESPNPAVRWIQSYGTNDIRTISNDIDMALDRHDRLDDIIEGHNTPYSPSDESHDNSDPLVTNDTTSDMAQLNPIVEGHSTPYSPLEGGTSSRSPFNMNDTTTASGDMGTPFSLVAGSPYTSGNWILDEARLYPVIEGHNTPYSPIVDTADDMATHGQAETAFDDMDAPASPAELSTIIKGHNTPYSPIADSPNEMATHGQTYAASDNMATPFSPIAGPPNTSSHWTRAYHTNHFNADASAYGHRAAALPISMPESPPHESSDNSGDCVPGPRTTLGPPIHMSTIFDMTASQQKDAIVHGMNTPYSPVAEAPDSRINDINITPHLLSPARLGALIEGFNTPYSPIEGGASSRVPLDFNNPTPYKNSRAFDDMDTQFSPIAVSPDSRINDWISDVATHGQTDTAIDDLDLPYSPMTDATDVTFGRDTRVHDSAPGQTFDAWGVNSLSPNSGSGTQQDPFIIDDETADRMVAKVVQLHETRGGRAASRSQDVLTADMDSPTPHLLPTANASGTTSKDSGLPRQSHVVADYINDISVDNTCQPFQPRTNLARELHDLDDIDDNGPSRPVTMLSGKRSMRHAATQTSRQYLFVELPQEIEDMIFDFAFPGSDQQYIKIKSKRDWDELDWDLMVGRKVKQPYPGHKVNEFLGVSKRFFQAASRAYLRNQGFEMQGVSSVLISSILNRACSITDTSSLMKGCTKLAAEWTTWLSPLAGEHRFPALKRLEYRPATWELPGSVDISDHILDKDELKKLKAYEDICELRGLVEFRISPQLDLGRLWGEKGVATDACIANMANLEALLKPLVTQPKPRSTSTSVPVHQTQQFLVRPPSPVEENQAFIDTLNFKPRPFNVDDQFDEGVIYETDEGIIKSFVKDPSGFIAWAREMKKMKDGVN